MQIPSTNSAIKTKTAKKSPSPTRTGLDFFEAFQNEDFCDAILRTDYGIPLKIHRNVMSNKSPYFHALFINGMKFRHSTINGLQDVTIPSVLGAILSLVVYFMYTKDRSKITHENVAELAVAADYLDVPSLRLACSDFMMEHLMPANAMDIMRFAHFNNYMDLHRKAEHFILLNFVHMSEPANCQQLMDATEQELAAILGDDRLNVKDEMLVFHIIKKWVEEDHVNRQHQVSIPFEKLRCAFLDDKDFKDVQIFAEQYSCNIGGLFPARLPPQILFAIGGCSPGEDEPSNIIETWDSRADVWHTVTNAEPMRRIAYHGCVVIQDQIFLIGGSDGVEVYRKCYKFCTTTRTWTEVAPMHKRRCYVSVSKTADDMIYAMGGYDGRNAHNSVERYDYRTNQWTMVAPMTIQRSEADAAFIDGKLLVVGGCDDRGILDTAEIYNPMENTWTLIPTPMSSRRSGVSCVAADGFVYAVGGYDGQIILATAERLELRTSRWTPIASMMQGRTRFAIGVVEGCILAIGGTTGTSNIDEVEKYNISSNTWEPARAMSVPRSALFACTMVPRNVSDYMEANRQTIMPISKNAAFGKIMQDGLLSSLYAQLSI